MKMTAENLKDEIELLDKELSHKRAELQRLPNTFADENAFGIVSTMGASIVVITWFGDLGWNGYGTNFDTL